MSDAKMVQITEDQLKVLQGAHSMLEKLYNHPEKAMEFKKLAKDAGYKVPELDVIEKVTKPYDEKIEGLTKKFDELDSSYKKRIQEDRDEKDTKSLKDQLDTIQKEYGFSDEGMQKVIARMKEKNNPDAESAAAWVKSKEPAPKITTNSSNFSNSKFNGANLTGGGEAGEKAWQSLLKDANTGGTGFFDEVVADVLNNPENSREFGGNA